MTKRFPGKPQREKERVRLGHEKGYGNLVKLAKRRPNNPHIVKARKEGRIV